MDEKRKGKQSIDVSHKSDHIYVNCALYNDTTDSVPMIFDQTFSDPIVDVPDDYHLAIVRFSVPGTDIPILQWPGNEFYSITLSYDGNDYQSYVELVAPSTSDTDNNVWFYEQMIQMINIAFQNCFDAMILANPGIASVAPYLTYDSATQLISLNAETVYPDTPIDIFFNFNLNQLIQSIDEFTTFGTAPNLKECQMYVRDEKNNHITIESSVTLATAETKGSANVTSAGLFTSDLVGAVVSGTGVPFGTIVSVFVDVSNITLSNAVTVTATNDLIYLKQLPGYQMVQEYSTLYTWNSLQSLVFVTGSLPTRNELINPIIYSEGSGTVNGARLILNDFEPVNDPLSAGAFRSYFQYQPQIYRYTDMRGTIPIYRVDFRIFWSNNEGTLTPMSLNPNESFTVKLLFEKRRNFEQYRIKD